MVTHVNEITSQRKQGAIDCAPTRRAVVDAVCVNNVTTSRVASTLEYTDVFTFASYKTLEHYLFYFLSGKTTISESASLYFSIPYSDITEFPWISEFSARKNATF